MGQLTLIADPHWSEISTRPLELKWDHPVEQLALDVAPSGERDLKLSNQKCQLCWSAFRPQGLLLCLPCAASLDDERIAELVQVRKVLAENIIEGERILSDESIPEARRRAGFEQWRKWLSAYEILVWMTRDINPEPISAGV